MKRFITKNKENDDVLDNEVEKDSSSRMAVFLNKLSFKKAFSKPIEISFTKLYEKLKVNDKLILLESKHGDDIAGNIFSILSELKSKTYNNFTVFLALKKEKMVGYAKLLDKYNINNVNFVEIRSKQYLELLASAKYLVTDTSFPTFYIKRPEQIYLNTWHGTPLKRMGRTVTQREYGIGNIQKNFLVADYLLYQNEFSKNVFLRDYMIDEVYQGTILMSGYPRNTAFYNTDRYEQIRRECGIENKQVMVYMPTWRGLLHKQDNKRQVSEIYDYLLSIDSKLLNSQVLYVKLHPFVKSEINYGDFVHIKAFPEDYETYDFLNASDLLITDYSSIMFDYAVSKKKIILFTYDREEYLSGRGMYLDLNTIGLPMADTVDELIHLIGEKEYDYKEFFEKYCSLDHKECTKEVCEKVFLNKEVPKLRTEKIVDSAKQNVLVYLDRVPVKNKLPELIQYLNELNTENYHYFLSFKAERFKKSSELLGELKSEISFIPIQQGINITISEKNAYLLMKRFGINNSWTTKKLKALEDREVRKNYGDLEFSFSLANVLRQDWKQRWLFSREAEILNAGKKKRKAKAKVKGKVKGVLRKTAKESNLTRDLYRYMLHINRKRVYTMRYKKNKVDDKLVIFECFRGKGFTCNPKALYQAMLNDEKYKDFHFVWAFNDVKKFKYLNENRDTLVVKRMSPAYYKAMASAKYVVSNAAIPRYVTMKPTQIYLQTWHGTPLKRLGCDIEVEGSAAVGKKDIHKQYMKNAQKFTYFITSSAYSTDKLSSAFAISKERQKKIIIEEGYPRNDALFTFDKEDILKYKEELGIKSDKKVILYAPTFRDNNYKFGEGFDYSWSVNWEYIKEQLSDEYVILLRTHYLVSSSFDFTEHEGFIYDVSAYEDINNLYIISDLLITDYSSVFFDYANLKRPIIFYMYDLDEYQNQIRDFYLDLSELPGPITKTQDQLVEEIKNVFIQFKFDDKYKKFNDKYNYLDDGKASQRVLERMITKEKSEANTK